MWIFHIASPSTMLDYYCIHHVGTRISGGVNHILTCPFFVPLFVCVVAVFVVFGLNLYQILFS